MAHNLLLQLRLILVFGLPAAISIAPAARTRELVIDSCELFDLLKSSAHAPPAVSHSDGPQVT